ncbi:hypothetical protein M011DRAFT_196456 [Sporormia fimetaria CBS 119925]|uniref:Flap structure-specific endonuclease n=1 Tax=Sporormia fimetaria CBS 119925 TaxID=1340428 RepID=A0A6A6V223_9PLEO|nr:hypothetical protein M011DRAFT_196456 [Sporormia fimetaria CBS 119925]
MGIHGIYKEIGPGQRKALSKLAVDKFEETGRPLRLAIDVSIWLFQIQAGKGGTNPAPRTFYYRLLRLVALCINPVFVFDGPNKPPFKRGKKTGAHVSSIPDFLAKQLIKQFGFPIHYAPGEAEAECALLQRKGIVDAVLSEDVDTLMFGSGVTIRNWSAEGTSKTPTHVNVYEATKTKSGPSGLDREGMILVALMSGGDYVPGGIPNCGPKIACEAARGGFGRELCRLTRTDKAGLREWRERLQEELKFNRNKVFATKHGAIKIPEDFPNMEILSYYTHPVVSNQAALDKLRDSMSWDKEIDFAGLREFTEDAFDWRKLEGAKHFVRSLAPAMLVRGLRMRGERDPPSSDDLESIRADESLLVKGIHGKRTHAVTDHTTELRVSYKPIELVRIDLDKEEPDDELPDPSEGQDDPDASVADLGEEDESATTKRGSTKFDPSKPARIWVMETYVKVGVPLTAEDWAASRQLGKRARPTKESTRTSTAKGGRRPKATLAKPQASILQFAKATKPGLKALQADPRPQAKAAKSVASSTINLLSSSPPKPFSHPPLSKPRERSLSPLPEIPPSVTRRRKRGPLQRSHTLPADLDSPPPRPRTPPPSAAIEFLDLVSSPATPSPGLLPAKKARTTSVRTPTAGRGRKQDFVITSPSKAKQTTLDAWARSSPAGTPGKIGQVSLAVDRAPLPPPPPFSISHDIETLDFTKSSPVKAPAPPLFRPSSKQSHDAETNKLSALTRPRPPLRSISSNASSTSSRSNSNSSTTSKTTTRKAPTRKGRENTPTVTDLASTPDSNTVDLTLLSSPPTSLLSTSRHSTTTAPPPPTAKPTRPSPTTQRRSPRNHKQNAPHHVEKQTKKLVIKLSPSSSGTWQFQDADVFGSSPVTSGFGRRKWRESQVGFLDLVDSD